jgi:hypothetical protein
MSDAPETTNSAPRRAPTSKSKRSSCSGCGGRTNSTGRGFAVGSDQPGCKLECGIRTVTACRHPGHRCGVGDHLCSSRSRPSGRPSVADFVSASPRHVPCSDSFTMLVSWRGAR